MIAFLTFKWRF